MVVFSGVSGSNQGQFHCTPFLPGDKGARLETFSAVKVLAGEGMPLALEARDVAHRPPMCRTDTPPPTMINNCLVQNVGRVGVERPYVE